MEIEIAHTIKKDSNMMADIQLFNGSGSLPGVHTIVLQDDAAAVVPRSAAVAKRPQLKRELDHQVQPGFFVKMTEPTDWVNSLIIVEKANEQMRLYVDRS